MAEPSITSDQLIDAMSVKLGQAHRQIAVYELVIDDLRRQLDGSSVPPPAEDQPSQPVTAH